jgi:hypothetical protein
MNALFSAVLVAAAACGAGGDTQIRLLPDEIVLNGPKALQRVVVENQVDGFFVADLTGKAQFAVADPQVATVDAGGVVRPAGDGETTLTATANGLRASARIRVRRSREPFTWSFRNHVIPMLTRSGCNSGACHGALAGKGGMKLSLRGYDVAADHFVLTRQALGRRIDPHEPARSLALLKPTTALRHGGGQKLEVHSDNYRVLAEWIAAGAPGPAETDPRIVRIEVLPAAVTLAPGATQSLVVRAHYSDGHVQDVTRWAKFASSESLVAAVDEDGRVAVSGSGEAAVNVIYSNEVAFCRVTTPFPQQIDSRVFAASPRNNLIDDHVLRKLAALHLPPSPPCSDREFIRRAYLDATGTLPTPEEVTSFLAHTGGDRRARLIDALIARSEFVDYWTYKWSDLLLVSSKRLPGPAMWAFYQWIRKAVAENKPWDQFARELLTASGSALQNGAANYYVLHKDVTELTETTSVTFLGMSLTCARCHNHPLEKWTQDQYYGMANLFARVGLKDGERGGDVIVYPAASGEILHPRRGEPMRPQPLDAPPMPRDGIADRRAHFAEWLTRSDNPYFARAVVNRVWRNFMGRGLVEAEDDLRATNPASNEPLLDALAKDFVAAGYDLRHLMRLIMNSAAYQRSSRPTAQNAVDDRFYSYYLVRRLPAEVVLDAYAQVTGVPTVFAQVRVGSSGGVENTANYPAGTRALQLPDTQVVSTFLDSFGRPERAQTCSCERQQDSSVSQALHLSNGATLNEKLRAAGSRVEQWLADHKSADDCIRRLFDLALCRPPSDDELQRLRAILGDSLNGPTPDPAAAAARRQAIEDLFWAVLTDQEFVFNH